jgi:thiamine-monophosphate kinase
VAAGLALRGLASSAIDISDGLVADLAHVLLASGGLGAQIDLGRLPTTHTLAEHFPDDAARWRLQLAGGDDYELCFTARSADALAIERALADCDTMATVIGRVDGEAGIRLVSPDDQPFQLPDAGFQHFHGRMN